MSTSAPQCIYLKNIGLTAWLYKVQFSTTSYFRRGHHLSDSTHSDKTPRNKLTNILCDMSFQEVGDCFSPQLPVPCSQ